MISDHVLITAFVQQQAGKDRSELQQLATVAATSGSESCPAAAVSSVRIADWLKVEDERLALSRTGDDSTCRLITDLQIWYQFKVIRRVTKEVHNEAQSDSPDGSTASLHIFVTQLPLAVYIDRSLSIGFISSTCRKPATARAEYYGAEAIL